MSYSSEVYSKVNSKFNLLIAKNAAERERRMQEVYEKLPRLKEIDDEIANEGLNLTRIALSHEGDIESEIAKSKKRLNSLKSEKNLIMMNNGFSIDYYENVYNCKNCKDSGVLNGKQCECYKKIAKTEAYKVSGLAEIIGLQNFEAFNFEYYSNEVDQKEGISPRESIRNIFDECKSFATNFPGNRQKGLLLYGDTGRGKTFLSSCIAKMIMDNGHTVIYQTAPRIFAIMEELQFGNKSDNSQSKVNELYSCDLLIIDDLGSEFTTRFTITALFDIINTRIMQGKKMVISSNLSLMDINERYMTRIFSRLTEFRYLPFIGNDIRLIKNFGI